jgi:RNA polymerase sigma factor (sigma-70 family)
MTSAVTNATDDASLVERLCQGDERALGEVYDRHANLVFCTARRIVVDRQAAEDVTQEVFLWLWNHATAIDETRGGLRPFVMTVARRRAIDYVRQEERRRRRQVRAIGGWSRAGHESVCPDFADELAEQDLAVRSCRAVREAVASLPADEVTAIELAYGQGRTLRDVAVVAGWPEGTAKSRVRRALHRLEHDVTLQGLFVA